MTLIRNEAVTQLLSFSAAKKVAFLVLLYERMMPELRAFCIAEGRDFAIFQKAREEYWRSCLDGSHSISWGQLREDVLDATPDTEDFGSLEASFALNAALVAVDIAEFLENGRDIHIAQAMRCTLDSLDAYVRDKMGMVAYDKATNNAVSGHPLVQKEARTQEGDIAFLSAIEDPPWSESTYSLVRARAESQQGLFS